MIKSDTEIREADCSARIRSRNPLHQESVYERRFSKPKMLCQRTRWLFSPNDLLIGSVRRSATTTGLRNWRMTVIRPNTKPSHETLGSRLIGWKRCFCGRSPLDRQRTIAVGAVANVARRSGAALPTLDCLRGLLIFTPLYQRNNPSAAREPVKRSACAHFFQM